MTHDNFFVPSPECRDESDFRFTVETRDSDFMNHIHDIMNQLRGTSTSTGYGVRATGGVRGNSLYINGNVI